jgi:heme A synthase
LPARRGAHRRPGRRAIHQGRAVILLAVVGVVVIVGVLAAALAVSLTREDRER